MKSKYKIILLLVISSTLLLLLFGASIYYFQSKYSYNDFYKRLETRARLAGKYFSEANRSDADALKRLRNDHLEKLADEMEYIIPDKGVNELEQTAIAYRIPSPFLSQVHQGFRAQYQDKDLFYYGIRYKAAKGGFIVVVSARNDYAAHYLDLLRNLLVAAGIISVLIITYLSFYFSRYIFNPIRKITDEVNRISSDNFHLRLEDDKNDKEINELISTFNNLLNRIETTFETHKNFISNASHEFGTPLTAIIGEADVTLLKTRSAEEYQDALHKILLQAERLNKVSQSLLFLAQTGYRENKLALGILRGDELIFQAKEIMDQLLPSNNIRIDFSLLPEDHVKLKIYGNKELLTLALTNILNNACKYSDNKPVMVSIASTNQELVLVVRDEGIGIPEEDMPYIYDPFYRAANVQHYEGYGIGLPLTRNIIKIHKGRLQISSVKNEGVTVMITLPLAKI
jgi:signal transduction histidine kinase